MTTRRTRRIRDYPRVRGEDTLLRKNMRRKGGLPPRARGRPHGLEFGGRIEGTTPACAGKTRSGSCPRPRRWDYPRVRGEDCFFAQNSGAVPGLPPRARGRPVTNKAPRLRRGTTPACAGKTGIPGIPEIPERDYPRVRGEDGQAWRRGRHIRGLPPRARGRRGRGADHRPGRGTTPACAGKTRRRARTTANNRDYPRVRGEDPPGGCSRCVRRGLPPRARGRPSPRAPAPGRSGTTPACAGKTSAPTPRVCSRGDYPRVRGEDGGGQGEGGGGEGLPPRARGRRKRHHQRQACRGTTPACAGKTCA